MSDGGEWVSVKGRRNNPYVCAFADALKLSELVDQLELDRVLCGHKWHVQATCASTGDGVYEVMDSLFRLVKHFNANRRYL